MLAEHPSPAPEHAPDVDFGFPSTSYPAVHRLYLSIADGMSIARVWARRYSKGPPRRGGHFEYRRAHTRAMDM